MQPHAAHALEELEHPRAGRALAERVRDGREAGVDLGGGHAREGEQDFARRRGGGGVMG